MPELTKISKNDLLLFAFSREKTFYKDFAKLCHNGPQCVGGSRLARQTMTNYLEDLEAEGFLKKAVAPGDKFQHYHVPKNKYREVAELKARYDSDEEFKKLSVEEQAAKVDEALLHKDRELITHLIALNGWLNASQIALQTGIERNRVLEAIWGKHNTAGMPDFSSDALICRFIDSEKDNPLPFYMRNHGMSFEGVYLTIKNYPDDFEKILEKWSSVHPFILARYPLLKKHGLGLSLFRFINEVDVYNLPLMGKKEHLEDMFLSFFPKDGGHISEWFNFIREDAEFRQRLKKLYLEKIDSAKSYIHTVQHAMEAIDNLASTKPNLRQREQDKGFFVSLM
jgi:hypothetical protein